MQAAQESLQNGAYPIHHKSQFPLTTVVTAGCTGVIAEWCTSNSPQITVPSDHCCNCWNHTIHTYCRRTRANSIDDPQGTSDDRGRFQHLFRPVAEECVGEAEVKAFRTLSLYKLLLTTYIRLGKMKAAKN